MHADPDIDEQHDDAAALYLSRALARVREAEAAAVEARAAAQRASERCRRLRQQGRALADFTASESGLLLDTG